MNIHTPLRGFTMLELLLTVAALTILVAAVLIVIEPERILEPFDNVNQESDIRTINSALRQYYIDTRSYPEGVDETLSAVCKTGTIDANTDPISEGIDCSNKIDLSVLVPKYIASIPFVESDDVTDPTDSGYRIVRNSEDNRVSVTSGSTQDLVVTPEIALVNTYSVETGDNSVVTLPFTPQEGNLLVVSSAHRLSVGNPVMNDDWNLALYNCAHTAVLECASETNTNHRRGLGMWWQQVDADTTNTFQINWEFDPYVQFVTVREYSFDWPNSINVVLSNTHVQNSGTSSVDTLSVNDINISKYSLVVTSLTSRDTLGEVSTWGSSIIDDTFSQVAFNTSVSHAHSYGITDENGSFSISPVISNSRNINLGVLVFTFE